MSPTRRRNEALSPVDTAWLRMEDPTNLMMITGIFTFNEPVEFERLWRSIEERLLPYHRFKQRVVQPRLPLQSPFWEDDPYFNLAAHLHRIALPEPGDQGMLQDLINDLMSMPLDYSKPLWQFHLVENYGSGCALVCRLHHCIADGIALMRVLLSITDEQPDPPLPVEKEGQDGAGSSSSPRGKGSVLRPFQSAVGSTQRLANRLVHESLHTLVNPTRMWEAAKLGASSSAALGRLLLLPPDPETPFKGKLAVRKLCSWSRPIPLPDVKEVGRVTDGTVNDVLLTAVSGALGRYLTDHGVKTRGLDFRAVVPVNLRPAGEKPRLGNAFGLVFLSLPVGIEDAFDRLLELKRRMDNLKGTPEAIVAFGILNAIGVSTNQVQDIVVNIFGTKATAVMTNVPGPREIRYFAGQAIDEIMFWVPQSGRLGLGVSILSYNGKVLLGVATDAGLIPDPEHIIAAFHAEFDDLMELVHLARETDEEMARRTAEEDYRCQAATKRGRRCKNHRLPGSDFCHLHQA